MDTIGTMTYESVQSVKGAIALEISLTGLHGGHSGDEIHKGYRQLSKNHEPDII